MKRKENRTLNLILGLFVVLYFLTGSVLLIINDVNVDLSRSKQVVGQVIYADIREIKNFSIKYTTYSRVFYFKLNNSTQHFTVQNSYEGYDDLQSNIKIGDTIKVYYGLPLLDDYNRHVFQIEKGRAILVAYSEYKENASRNAGIGLFLSIIFLIGLIMWFKKINLVKFLNSLVGA